ncbi:Rrf2 family nitric oxide-sensitive transcriptional repressor [Chryseobacterium sp. H1D6B]|uniref:RrF2 family transcriptional regulator n=1 Tax=Chryseobacterium sp. H1D6B TaxID=2940588 RepID=UPI0015CDB466|nr:Rrf2 family transcriptional regulator [Chryseobacterium sp. H1D6B]MDH6250648.1 Rrf2 family nitric oxide-sensitive transcriptional repressor [Chryseobacterium sp. H1D6B]
MRLNHFTDYSLRVLMYLNKKGKTSSSSLDELSGALNILRNHLIKVVQFLSKEELVITKRGKNGGIIISDKAVGIGLGSLIHLLEQDDTPVINCHTKPCVFMPYNCKLKSFLDTAYKAFLDSMNEHSLSDLAFNNWEIIFADRHNAQNHT